MQLGDWLDPMAPPDAPFLGRTDSKLIATAYFARSAQIVSDAAGVLGHSDLEADYADLAAEVRRAFRREYVTPNGRVMSDTVTALLGRARIRDDRGPGRIRAGRGPPVELRRRVAVHDHHRLPRHPSSPPGTEQQRPHHDGVSAGHPDPTTVVVVLGAPRSDDDVGAVGQPAPRRLGQPRRDDVVQPLRLRLRRRVDAPRHRWARPGRARVPPPARRAGSRPWRERGDRHPAHALRPRSLRLVVVGHADHAGRRRPAEHDGDRSSALACPIRSMSAPATTSGPTTSPTTSSTAWRDESWNPGP